MVDPRKRDPRFPDRPTHPDFIRLSEIVQRNDQRAEAGENPFTMAGVDEETMKYFIHQRMGIMAARLYLLTSQPLTLANAMALYLDAFVLGQRFAEERAKDEEAR